MTQRSKNHVADLIGRYFGRDGGELMVGQVAVDRLAADHGTPLFVYSRDALDRTWQAVTKALPPGFDVYYSIKANPNQTILKYFLDQGCGLEVASAGELHQALAAGCPAENVVFAGPGKTSDELSTAVSSGVGEIHVESLAEARRLARIAVQHNQRVPVALRVNPCAAAQGGAMRMGGKPAPFGIDEECLIEVTDTVIDLPGVQLCGVHLFSGTQILDADILMTQYRKAVEIADHVARRTGTPLKTIDFGGGWGIPYFAHEQRLDVESLRPRLDAIIADVQRRPLLADARLLIEPGRFLVGEAGVYVTQVIEVKRSRGKSFVITDGGMHHHLAASGNLGQTIKRNYPVAAVNKLHLPADVTVDVVGPLCTPLDVLARGVDLPRLEPGDLIGIFQSGAYGRSASPMGFLSHPSPPEVWVDKDQHWQIRRRGNVEDYLLEQSNERTVSHFV